MNTTLLAPAELDDLLRFRAACVLQLTADLHLMTPGLARFLEGAFAASNAELLARALEVPHGTLASRFRRAGLPSPREYVVFARLVLWARYLERTPVSAERAAVVFGCSSASHLMRHIRSEASQTFAEFRALANGVRQFDVFRERLWLPHRYALAGFEPVPARSLTH